jgi:hypothetical protein
LAAAQAVLDGKLGAIEGSRALANYAHDIVPNWSADPDFVVFGAIASETDDVLIGETRRYWSPRALAESDELSIAALSQQVPRRLMLQTVP